ncbi:head GIN domain-containing protein [Aurantiacibacter gangjinensis]|uniref:Putative auto-transporter adhesin head GIN domain-containing protein n=1 Tax=Aurantiacibacter gangjinensis TaxID=502682 RepID=A0A0G9MLK8_9SPHN|nr:head GIN domain-containing protein [Aurantiacibacter gangjinensis]APE27530.1 hypothetical protein BMF35_a0701 [Aurantiacibacter gangjinensis]KLE31582.1 hypothetical protein AAW01_08475 [Aurantiacibacter gangjinensis]
MGIGRTFALAAMAGLATLGLSACNMSSMSAGGDGVPLAEVDFGAEAPTMIALAGSDSVTITRGSRFAISVDGTPVARERMRFELEGSELLIHRDQGTWTDSDNAQVSVTVPSLSGIAVIGSGDISADTMTGDATIEMPGAGTATIAQIEAASVEVDIAGSGTVSGAGSADSLSVNIAGSGDVEFEQLSAEDVEVNIAGSGDVTVRSDGNVEANFVGSGDVRVIGSARCESTTVGSGSLICEDA